MTVGAISTFTQRRYCNEHAAHTHLLERVKAATWHWHASFERLPFITALTAGTLPLESYLGQLRGLAIIIGSLERRLRESSSLLAGRLRPALAARFEMICADLSHFAPRLVPDILPAVRCALDITSDMRSINAGSDRLLGFLYVLQGTTRGNRIHLPDVIRCFNVIENGGVRFYTGYGEQTESHWEEFRTAVDAAAGDIDEGEFRAGTEQMYASLEHFHALLYPLSETGRGFTASGLNPEAGDHTVPQDADTLAAALRAGERCRVEFPYYAERYGERGRRFTASDAAWLASLSGQTEAVVADQTLWLGRLLAVRGMPTMLLERQLEMLVEELGAGEQTAPLQTVRERMRTEREAIMPTDVFDRACHDLSAVFESFGVDCAGLPVIIASAWLDGLKGIPECPASVLAWLQSSKVLSAEHVSQLEDLLERQFGPLF